MSFETVKKDGYVVVSSQLPKLDGRYSPELKAILTNCAQEGDKNVILNLADTQYCDSSGLSAILIGNRLSKNVGGTFAICGLSPMVSKLITLSQLDSILNIVPTLDEAIQFVLMEQTERELGNEE